MSDFFLGRKTRDFLIIKQEHAPKLRGGRPGWAAESY